MFHTLFKKRESSHKAHVSHNAFFEALRKKEYPQLDEQRHVYLDYTGGNLSPLSLLEHHFEDLKKNIFLYMNFVALMKTRKAQTIHQLTLQNPVQMGLLVDSIQDKATQLKTPLG